MIDGHLPQPRLEDLRPTRLHLVLIGITVLLAPLYWLAIKFHPEMLVTDAVWKAIVSGAFFVAFLFFAGMLGGPQKLWTDWRDRNWYGYYWVEWLKGANHLGGHFVNRKNLPNVVMPGWSLHVPLGGWFARPFLAHSEDKPRWSRNFHVRSVKWTWSVATDSVIIDFVTVSDRAGRLWSASPHRLLRDLQETFSTGDWHNDLMNGLEHVFMSVDMRYYKSASELASAKEQLDRQHALAAAGIGVIWETIWNIFETSRLDGVKSKEGRTVREKLTAYYYSLERMPGAGMHAFGLLLPVDKKSARPERISSNGPVQKMF